MSKMPKEEAALGLVFTGTPSVESLVALLKLVEQKGLVLTKIDISGPRSELEALAIELYDTVHG